MNVKSDIIYLIGLMGSGKSTLGPQLARNLQYEFIDMDSYIEEKEQLSIPQIFQKQGEDFFRKVEAEALNDLSSKQKVVISTGGGTPCFHDNLDVIKKTGYY